MSIIRENLIRMFCCFCVWWGVGSTFIIVTGGEKGLQAGAISLAQQFSLMGWLTPIALILFMLGFLALNCGIIIIVGTFWSKLINDYLDKLEGVEKHD